MAGNRITLGNLEIVSVSDGQRHTDSCSFFPDVTPKDWNVHKETDQQSHKIDINLGSYVIRSDEGTILIDTGLGPGPDDPVKGSQGRLLENLDREGIDLNDIGAVLMTHWHPDHVGWNVSSLESGYKPTFPNALYYLGETEWDFFMDPNNLHLTALSTTNAVVPLENLGILRKLSDSHIFSDCISVLHTPGHTPGHLCILITSENQKALILGDAAHHPIQVEETDWCSSVDLDPERTRHTRRFLMEKIEQEDMLLIAGHFPAPGFGRIVRANGRRTWIPL